ncbi:MAG: hypothetical protein ACE5JD_16675 [Candidatus Methylomirabilia bacterium]
MRVSRDDLKRFLDGHRAADARLREEAMRRLPSLSVDDARAEYDSLCLVWETSRTVDDGTALDRQAIQERVALRRRLSGRR